MGKVIHMPVRDKDELERRIALAEAKQAEQEAALDEIEVLLATAEQRQKAVRVTDYLLVAVSCLLVYILPIWLGIPVILFTMWMTRS